MNTSPNPEPKGFISLIAETVKGAARLGGAVFTATLPVAFTLYGIFKASKIVGGIGVAIANADPAAIVGALNELTILLAAFRIFELVYIGIHTVHDWHGVGQWHTVHHEWRKLKLHVARLAQHVKKWFGK